MVEVFKTNVTDLHLASILVTEIRKRFNDYAANFDLQDCDRILRVKCNEGCIQSLVIIKLFGLFGCTAEILTDDQPTNIVLERATKNQ